MIFAKKDELGKLIANNLTHVFKLGHNMAVTCVASSVFFMNKDISQKQLFKLLKFIVKAPGDRIFLYIDSTGGCVASAFAMYEALLNCNKTVVSVAVHEVCSAAVLPFLAGTERYVSPHARILLHEVEAWENATTREVSTLLREKALRAEESTKKMFSLITRRTELTSTELKRRIVQGGGDWIISPADAIKYGVATKIGFPFPNKDLP